MRPKTILIIEDDQGIQSVLQIVLENEGYRVVSALNGQEGLDFLNNGNPKPDLILLDLMMPVVSGNSFLTELQTHHADVLESCGIIVMTAVNKPEVDASFPILRKPVELEELIAAVRTHIRD